jgi:hypothetical protein
VSAQHTPGPWQQYGTEIISIDSKGKVTKIADLCEPPVPYSASVMDANGALLAAVTELLAALQVLTLDPRNVEYLTRFDPMGLKQARAALAKANGGAA